MQSERSVTGIDPKFVDAYFDARRQGFRIFCLRCQLGFNEPECPRCSVEPAPLPAVAIGQDATGTNACLPTALQDNDAAVGIIAAELGIAGEMGFKRILLTDKQRIDRARLALAAVNGVSASAPPPAESVREALERIIRYSELAADGPVVDSRVADLTQAILAAFDVRRKP